MKISTPRPDVKFSRVAVVAVALATALAISVLPTHPAFAGDRGGDSRGDHGRRSEHRHGHRYPVYAPPTVYYPQQASRGISLVFPIQIR